MNKGPIEVSLKDTSQAVAVVPTLAPSKTPRLARKEMAEASTKAAVKELMALLDCTKAVAKAPTAKPFQRFSVMRASQRCMASPPTACSSRLKPCRP